VILLPLVSSVRGLQRAKGLQRSCPIDSQTVDISDEIPNHSG
jgi:hypothetical protein